MEESEDIKKMDDIIKRHKHEAQADFDEAEFAEFIDLDDNPFEVDDNNMFEIEHYEIPNWSKADIAKLRTFVPTQFLTESERGHVNSCTDPTLKELLILNRTKNMQLMQLYKKIKDMLVECQKNITMHEENMETLKQTKKGYARIWRLGIPYFKTIDDYPCPRNADTVKKCNKGEMFFYDMTPSLKWADRDKDKLLKGIAFQYQKNRELELEQKIEELTEVKSGKDEELIQELRNKLEDLKNSSSPSYPPINCDKYIDWDRLSGRFFKERYSGKDCKVFWRSCLHPEVNKGRWTPEENDKLKTLVVANNFQNWDRIAEELGTGRTGFLSSVQYYNKIAPLLGGRFSTEEDKLLCDLVEKYKQGEYVPWTKIAHHFAERTRSQLFYRYRYFLSCRQDTLKGRFTQAEDILILVLVDRFGKKFTKCGEYFPHRSVVQIKARYSSNLKGGLKKGSFSIEEDRKILEYVRENGSGNWEPLVRILSRCGGQIRQRFKTLMAFKRSHPGESLEKAPRRRYSGPSLHTEFGYVRLMADKFKSYKKIPSLEDIEMLLKSNPRPKVKPLKPLRRLRVQRNVERGEGNKLTDEMASDGLTKKSLASTSNKRVLALAEDSDNDEAAFPSLAMDDLITDFFCNSARTNVGKNINKEFVHKAASSLNNILSILQAELHIPKNYKSDCRLDAIDLDILEILKEGKPITLNDEYVMKRDSLHLQRMVAPTLNSIVGLRGLLLKNDIYKTKCAKRSHLFSNFRKQDMEKQVLWCINNYLTNQSENIQQQIKTERNIFFNRFVSLFKFPAIMSLVEPSKRLQTTASKSSICDSNAMRTYQKKPKTSQLPSFEAVYLKQSEEGDFELEMGADGNDYCTSTISRKEIKPHKELNLSIADQLKRRINETIKELTQSPSTKTFFHSTSSVCSPQWGSMDKANDNMQKIDSSTIASVIDSNHSKANKNRTYGSRTKRAKTTHSNDQESNFNLSKSELLLDTPSNQDLEDIKLLDDILKKEKDVVEESFDF